MRHAIQLLAVLHQERFGVLVARVEELLHLLVDLPQGLLVERVHVVDSHGRATPRQGGPPHHFESITV